MTIQSVDDLPPALAVVSTAITLECTGNRVPCVEALIKRLLEACRRPDMPLAYRLKINGAVRALPDDQSEQIRFNSGRLITRCNGESHECILSCAGMSAGDLAFALSTDPDVRNSVFIPKPKPAPTESAANRSDTSTAAAKKSARKKKRKAKVSANKTKAKPAGAATTFDNLVDDFAKTVREMEKLMKKP